MDDLITAEVEVININLDKNILTLNTRCYNQNNIDVIVGEAIVMPPKWKGVFNMLELVNIEREDLSLIMYWRMLPEVTKYMYTDPKLTLDGQIEWYNSLEEDKTSRYWIIKMDDIKIGLINICDIDYKNKKCSWAYYIGNTSFRGRGIATLLECNMYDYVFKELGLNKLCCEVFTFNEKVISIHEKFGSMVEGILKQHIYKNDSYYDIVVMGITKDRWINIKSKFNYDKILIQ